MLVGNVSLRRAVTTKAFPPRPSTRCLGVLAGARVQAGNCTTASRRRLPRDKSHRPAQPSLSRLSSTIGNNNNHNVNKNSSNSTAVNRDAAEALLRSMSDSLQGIGEALTLEDLKPSAPWGLAVYRTTYSDDAAWYRMKDALSEAVASTLELCGCADSLLPRLSHAFIEDRATLDGAGVHDVRRLFTNWAAEELRRNWRVSKTPPPTEEEARRAGVEGPGYFAGTRYNYCLMVDEVCLESLDRLSAPVVKLVKKDFTGGEQDGGGGRSEVAASLGWEDGVTDSDEEDVGWMYLPVTDYVDCCNQLHDPGFWHDGYYVRPPLTFLNRDFASAPGFWRREGHEA